jgi:hypothetical protein
MAGLITEVAEAYAQTAIRWSANMTPMTPEERAESLREVLQRYITLVVSEGSGHSWRLTDKGLARIAAVIRDAENDALERAANLCEVSRLAGRNRYSRLLGPDYQVTRTLVSRELAAAMREMKHKGER